VTLVRFIVEDTQGVDPVNARGMSRTNGRHGTFFEEYDALCYAIKRGGLRHDNTRIFNKKNFLQWPAQ